MLKLSFLSWILLMTVALLIFKGDSRSNILASTVMQSHGTVHTEPIRASQVKSRLFEQRRRGEGHSHVHCTECHSSAKPGIVSRRARRRPAAAAQSPDPSANQRQTSACLPRSFLAPLPRTATAGCMQSPATLAPYQTTPPAAQATFTFITLS